MLISVPYIEKLDSIMTCVIPEISCTCSMEQEVSMLLLIWEEIILRIEENIYTVYILDRSSIFLKVQRFISYLSLGKALEPHVEQQDKYSYGKNTCIFILKTQDCLVYFFLAVGEYIYDDSVMSKKRK